MCGNCPLARICQVPCAKLTAELEAVTVRQNGWEVLVSLDDLAYLWTSRSRLSLGSLQGAAVTPPLKLIFPLLTKQQKQIFVLKFIHRRTEREIAAALGIHHSSVHERLAWARKKVRAFLDEKQNRRADTPANYQG
jgi:hypothetical protein